MTEEERILELVSEKKIDVSEGMQLLNALKEAAQKPIVLDAEPLTIVKRTKPKWLRIVIQDGKEKKVNIKIPLMLLKAGVKLKSFLPDTLKEKSKVKAGNSDKVDSTFEFLLDDLDPKNLDAFIESLRDAAIEIEGDEGESIRIFCE